MSKRKRKSTAARVAQPPRRAAANVESRSGAAASRRAAIGAWPAAGQLQNVAAWLMLVAFWSWQFVINFRPVTNNDFWFHLRVGEDILRNGAVPHVDTYSAVAAGRPFLAHGWLAEVLFAIVERLAGPHGFVFVREVAALGTLGLLFLALPRAQRWRPGTLAVAAVGGYLTAAGVAERPLLFGDVLLAASVLVLETYRANRHRTVLGWLVPIFLLWANTHGSFLMGLAVVGTILATDALSYDPQPALAGSRDRPSLHIRWRQLGTVAVVMAACIAVTCVNPYGLSLWAFTLDFAGGQEFNKRAVMEWHPPFGHGSYFLANFPYLAWLFALWLVLLLAALLLRWRTRPWVDAAAALLVAGLGLRANRFIAYGVIVGFPIVVRSLRVPPVRSKSAESIGAIVKRAALAAVFILLSFTAIEHGFALGAGHGNPIGWGYAARMPEAEVAYIKQHHLHGTLYNESLRDGSYIIHELAPDVRPTMDARLEVYGETLYEEHAATLRSRAALMAYLAKYRVDLALVTRAGWLARVLVADPDWRLAYQTPARRLFVRRETVSH